MEFVVLCSWFLIFNFGWCLLWSYVLDTGMWVIFVASYTFDASIWVKKKKSGFEKKNAGFLLKKKRGAFTSVDNLDWCENRRFYIWENGTSDVKSPI